MKSRIDGTNPPQIDSCSKIKARSIFWILISISFLIRLAFVIITPFCQTVQYRIEGLNDEPAHYNYVKYLVDEKKLPVQTHSAREQGWLERNDFEYHQPPLYYLLCTPFYAFFGHTVGLYFGRFLSLAFVIPTLILIYSCCQLINLSRSQSQAVVLFAAFWPNHSYFASLLSNDSISWFFFIWLTFEGLIYAKSTSAKIGNLVRIGICLGVGLLIKSSLLIGVPAIGICFFVKFLQKRIVSEFIKVTGTALGIAFLIASPWYIRNLVVYNSLTVLELANGPYQRSISNLSGFVQFFKSAVRCFWFPMQHLSQSVGTRIITYTLTVILFSVLLYGLKRAIHPIRQFKGCEVFLGSLLMLTSAAYISYNLHWYNDDGRFLLPAIVPIALLFVKQIKKIISSEGSFLLIAISLLCLLPFSYLFFVI